MLRFLAPRFPDYLPLTELLTGRRSVVFLGATLGSLSSPDRPETAHLLAGLARAGIPMTFGLVDPDAPAHVHETLATWLGTSPDDVQQRLRTTLRFLRQLRADAGPHVERIAIHGLHVLPSSGVAMVDHETPSIRARLALYPMQATPRYDPFIEGDRSTPEGRTLCDLCLNHFTRLTATSLDLSDGST
jgi:hypothetical protein